LSNNKSIKNFRSTSNCNCSSTSKPFPFKDKYATYATIVEGGSKVFGGKLVKEVFNANGSVGSLEAKGHGASFDVRLLELRLVATKKNGEFEAHKRFQGCHN
jgi:hypothetical protein